VKAGKKKIVPPLPLFPPLVEKKKKKLGGLQETETRKRGKKKKNLSSLLILFPTSHPSDRLSTGGKKGGRGRKKEELGEGKGKKIHPTYNPGAGPRKGEDESREREGKKRSLGGRYYHYLHPRAKLRGEKGIKKLKGERTYALDDFFFFLVTSWGGRRH